MKKIKYISMAGLLFAGAGINAQVVDRALLGTGTFGTGFGFSSSTTYNYNAAVHVGTAGPMYYNTLFHTTFVGVNAGIIPFSGFDHAVSNSVYLGYSTGQEVTGDNNTMLGTESGHWVNGSGNVFIGYQAGKKASNTTVNNQLYIANSNTSSPLIWGDFGTNTARVNGTLAVGIFGVSAPARALHVQTTSTNGGLRVEQKSTGVGFSALELFNSTTGGHNLALVSTGAGNSEGAGHFGLYDYSGGGYKFFVHSTGNVGIGTYSTSPIAQLQVNNINGTSWAGYFGGNVYVSGTITTSSDRKLKKDIKEYTGGLDKIMQLNPCTYTYKVDQFKGLHLAEGNQYGLIAQEVEQVFPELVKEVAAQNYTITDSLGTRNSELNTEAFKSVNYTGLIPVVISAIKQQQKLIEEQQATIDELKKQLAIAGINLGKEDATEKVKLYQNNPNPATKETVIRFDLPKEVNNAFIGVYDLSGKQLMTLPITSGSNSVTINASALGAGMYIYSIVANNNIVDSKRMIVTEK